MICRVPVFTSRQLGNRFQIEVLIGSPLSAILSRELGPTTRRIIGLTIHAPPHCNDTSPGSAIVGAKLAGPKAGGPLNLSRMAGLDDMLGLPRLNRIDGKDAGGRSTLPGSQWLLPGPTGERNTLRFAPRGNMLCLSRDSNALRA